VDSSKELRKKDRWTFKGEVVSFQVHFRTFWGVEGSGIVSFIHLSPFTRENMVGYSEKASSVQTSFHFSNCFWRLLGVGRK
jgi:hypothetical protein